MPDLSAERRQVLRFLALGASNTAVTYVLFVALAHVVNARLAYTCVFAAGVAFSVLFTGSFVFGAARTRRGSAAFAAWYLVVYGVGLLSLEVLRAVGLQRPVVVGMAVLTVTTPLNFLGGRLLFGRRGPRRGPGPASAADLRCP